MPAISKAWVSIADSAVDPDSPLDATLMTGIRDDLVHLREWLGASFFAGAVQDHNHDGANSALIEVGPNLLRNGSFENDGAGWTITNFTGGSHAFSTSTRHHGAKSIAITSTSTVNGGGNALTNEFVPVAGGEWYDWGAQVSASGANVSSRVSIVWYDAGQSQISEVNVYNVTNTPTAKAAIGKAAQAPSTARFARLRLTGGVPGAGAATGTVFFDGVSFSASGSVVLVDEGSVSGVANLDITSFADGRFKHYTLIISGLKAATSGVFLNMYTSANGGSSFATSAAYFVSGRLQFTTPSGTDFGGSLTNGMALFGNTAVGNSAAHHIGAVIKIVAPHDTTTRTKFAFANSGWTSGDAYMTSTGTAERAAAENNNALRLSFSSGNVDAAKWMLLGHRGGD